MKINKKIKERSFSFLFVIQGRGTQPLPQGGDKDKKKYSILSCPNGHRATRDKRRKIKNAELEGIQKAL